jgi:PAS domain S-box-containing protein
MITPASSGGGPPAGEGGERDDEARGGGYGHNGDGGDPLDPKVNILLVDDRPSNLLSLRGILERPDYNLVLARSGEEALRRILTQDFAVILLDVAMPEMDGFEVAAIIKQRERYRWIPIIFVTASVQHAEWIFKAYHVGAVDLLQKPIDPHAVRAKVGVFVELFRQKQQIRRQEALLREGERRERQLELSRVRLENDRRYRNLAEAIPHIVWTADAGGRIEYFNRHWFEATGLGESESLGGRWREALNEEDRPAVEETWAQSVAHGERFEIQCRLRQADGEHRWYLCRALPELVEGRIARWLGTFTDVDDQRRAHEKARSAVRLRDEFLSVASHELRTPLTSLQLHLQSLDRALARIRAAEGRRAEAPAPPGGPEAPAEARGASGEPMESRFATQVGSAVRQTERLARLVDSLLDVSRITTGMLELRPEELDLAEVARDVVQRFASEAARSGSTVELRADRPAVGVWDRLRMEQIVTNLLSNALKYGGGKPIEVSVSAGDGSADVVVRDHGIGIATDQLQRIFDRFTRGVPSRHYGGLGLGLYIVRQIVDAHGGHVEAISERDGGTTFHVHLPLSAPTHAAEPRLDARPD